MKLFKMLFICILGLFMLSASADIPKDKKAEIMTEQKIVMNQTVEVLQINTQEFLRVKDIDFYLNESFAKIYIDPINKVDSLRVNCQDKDYTIKNKKSQLRNSAPATLIRCSLVS